MNEQLAAQLAHNGITTRDDLAELGADELIDLIDMDEATAGRLIMADRAHWFADENAGAGQ
jgi:N utilization substance protein A